MLLFACTDEPRVQRQAPAAESRTPPAAGPRFTNDSREAAIPPRRIATWGSVWADHDGDGWPDLLINRHKKEPWLLANDNGSFTEIVDRALVAPTPGRTIFDRHNCAWGEANGDGGPDLFCGSGAQDGAGNGPNRLLLGGERLRDVTESYGVADEEGRARSVNWLDHDSDGDLDLFVGNETRPGTANRLYRNEGRRFVSVGGDVASEVATRSSSVADWDADGDPDLLVLGHGFVGSRAYENSDGVFEEVELDAVTGATWLSATWGSTGGDPYPELALVSEERLLVLERNGRGRSNGAILLDQRLRAGRVAMWIDIENDGDQDLFLVEGVVGDPPRPGSANHPDRVWLNEDGAFTEARIAGTRGPRTGNGDSVSLADYDRDGRVDMFVTNGYLEVFGPPQMLRNTSAGGDWAALSLDGGRKNPLAIGARVRLHTATGTHWRHLGDGMAFRSQSETNHVVFGLGDAASGRVRVWWTDGSSDCTSVTAGRTTELMRGSASCRRH